MSGKQAAELLGNFELPGKDYGIRELRQGLIHKTYLLLNNNVPEYILQQINTKVFPEVQALMGNLSAALSYLKAEDYQLIEVVRTRGGALFLDKGNAGCWRIMSFIPGSITYNTTSDPKVAREAGRIISRFHSLLQPAPAGEFADVLPGFHDLNLRKEQYLHALENAPSGRKELAKNAMAVAQNFLDYPFPFNGTMFPSRICHNDTKLNNILFSAADKKGLCLIDLDTIMEGYFLYDFGDAVRTIVNTAPEDERNLDKIHFSKPLFEAFIDGLGTGAALLKNEEITYLPYGAIYMPVLHGLRALTDFLSGDKYYQVDYEGQNLDRSMSLFTFAQRAAEQFEYMEKVVHKSLSPRND